MPSMEGFTELYAKLKLRARGALPADAVVGYTASYALHVDQNRQISHRNGRAGFLSDVAMESAKDLGRLAVRLLKRGYTLTQVVLTCGLELQRRSQKEAPVLTGNMKNSAFTRLEAR